MVSQQSEEFDKEMLLEGYKLLQYLSKKVGRMTLLARSLQTQELVTIKILLFDKGIEWSDFKLFEREAETLKVLSHPAIPRYLDYFELDKPNYKGFALVQSYISARSLQAEIEAGRTFSEEEVKQIAKDVLEILQYLHGRQPCIIHRDIKTSNILLTDRSGNSVGYVSLVDFGSIQTGLRKNSSMTVVGSYGYMPPEQFNGRATSASDFYSLGATLIYLITGHHPADLPDIDLRIQFEQVANISFGFSNWLKKMTEPIASQRFANAEEAMRSLEESGHTTQAQRKTTNSTVFPLADSKVVLNKNENFIEIIIPSKGLSINIIEVCLWISIVTIAILFFAVFIIAIQQITLLAFKVGFCFFFATFFINLVVLLIKNILYVLLHLFGNMRLCITQKDILQTFNVFGIEFHRISASPRQSIIQLEYTKDIENRPYITLWTVDRKYEIFTNDIEPFPVTPLELNWLAGELSEWLKLPISRE
ncbi:MAG: serine/threonine-protein kinase [Nostoc sp.]|uniref:serine/threonine protein kinase n=1 Tax=Nostoc sp. TaxID=1180 RepID=UPI002FF5D225